MTLNIPNDEIRLNQLPVLRASQSREELLLDDGRYDRSPQISFDRCIREKYSISL